MINLWVATPTQGSGWGRAFITEAESGLVLRRAPGSAPAFAGPAGPSTPPLSRHHTPDKEITIGSIHLIKDISSLDHCYCVVLLQMHTEKCNKIIYNSVVIDHGR